jgi:hypothetical protein
MMVSTPTQMMMIPVTVCYKAIVTGSAITVDVVEKSSSIKEILGSKAFSSHLDTDSSTFSLPKDWLCHHLLSGQISSSSKEIRIRKKAKAIAQHVR